MHPGRGAIAALALACTACSGRSEPASALPAGDGAQLYAQNCVPCHREDGRGVPAVYPSLAASPVVNGDATELARWVLLGKRPASMPPGRYSTQMLQFSWMKDEDAAAVLTHIRTSFGNQSPAVDAAAVAAARGS